MHSRSRRFGELAGHLRRLAVLAALAAYLAAAPAVPVPAPRAKARIQPFPCMDRACGCMNAAQCWKGCCCFSDADKLAWAAAHHVEPPAFVVRRVAAAAVHSEPPDSRC